MADNPSTLLFAFQAFLLVPETYVGAIRCFLGRPVRGPILD